VKYSWAYPAISCLIVSGCGQGGESNTAPDSVTQEQESSTSVGSVETGNTATSRSTEIDASTLPTIGPPWNQLQMTPQLDELRTVIDVKVSGHIQGSPVTPDQFSMWMANATALEPNAEIFQKWHYAPRCIVTFTSAGRQWTAQLYLGGLGILKDDKGQSGAFSFNEVL
jgi:hypothetical protein